MKHQAINKTVCVVLIVLAAFFSVSCTQKASEAINIVALKGPTAMGLAQLLTEYGGDEDAEYAFSLESQPELVGPKLLQGECDLAALPANLAATLYNKSEGKIQVIAINTLGVLYLAENGDSIKDVTDLRSKTIYSAGKGATPEIVLRMVLENNGIDPDKDVNLVFVSEHTEVVARMLAEEGSVGHLPEPYLTVASGKNPSIRRAIDLNSAWTDIYGESSPLITGVLVGRKDFLEENKKDVKVFCERYGYSANFAVENIDAAAKMISDLGIFEEIPAKKALPECNIVYIDGEDMKLQLSAYLEALFSVNPQVVGNKIPSDDFYFKP
ncbi:MAG: ABC transporter substrate-binding protein [Clostridiaceae bacterium]|jgi:NitT/TauT family transport system substrate-binding protein|nr:ABC transporter substrate-binding protein [Clostridiaceae bacterium]